MKTFLEVVPIKAFPSFSDKNVFLSLMTGKQLMYFECGYKNLSL